MSDWHGWRHIGAVALGTLAALSSVALDGCRTITGLDELSLDETAESSSGTGGDGSCGCSLPHAETSCDALGMCELVSCDEGYDSCDGEDESGCETSIRDDEANCGRCDRSCLGAACSSGRCQTVVLAENVGNPTVVLLHEDWVYYTTQSDQDTTIERVPRSPADGLPSSPEEIVSEPKPTFHALATDTSHLYWGSRSAGQIRRATLSGDQAIDLYVAVDPWDMKIDAEALHWTERDGGSLRRAPLDGSGPVEDLAVGLTRPFELVLDDSHIYWTDEQDITLNRLPRDGGAAELGISTSPRDDVRGMGLAISPDAVYWTGSTPSTPGDVLRYDKSSEQTTIAVAGDVTRSVAVDDTHLYWVDKVKNAVLRRPLAGGPEEVLAEQQLSAQGIVVDDEAAYWANFSGASIVKVAK